MRAAVYLVLVHYPTVDREGRRVATAVTTLDLHDLARLARTYGLGGVFATTPLVQQRRLVERLVGHWTEGAGARMNPCRKEALSRLELASDLGEVKREVERRWSGPALAVATSARSGPEKVGVVEARRRMAGAGGPVLVVFGTGWGLADEVVAECGWTLEPVRGFEEYNHLSVRSAASIVVDRLFGGT